ncbi:unnamed protein product [Amoebophrya sp. A25]|nr:unnamed protein product [Amoebophrya sp. A25]|eukprot:GSA25T00025694001.1
MGNMVVSLRDAGGGPHRRDESGKRQTGYIDGCFDIMHSGHYNAIRQARSLCDRLVVGIHSDAEIARNKGPPVMVQSERYGLLEHIKWIDEIAHDVPYSPTLATLDACGADFSVHGDDMPVNAQGVGAYDSLRDAGRLKIVKRTEGVSTTDFIGRLLSLSKAHHEPSSPILETTRASAAASKNQAGLSSQGVKLLASTRRISEFSKPHRLPAADDVVVYCDGSFDMFHLGHATTLKKAKALGTFLVVGIHDDDAVNRVKGANYPIATLQERVLCVCACKHVDEVIIGAPLEVTHDMLKTLNVSYVVQGSHTETHHFREAGYAMDVVGARNTDEDLYRVPKALGMMRTVDSDFPELNTAVIAQRVAENRLAYMNRNADREKREAAYYEEKATKKESIAEA